MTPRPFVGRLLAGAPAAAPSPHPHNPREQARSLLHDIRRPSEIPRTWPEIIPT